MKVAVVGAGVAGLTCAWLLHDRCEVTVFESDARLGGHAHTVDVQHEKRTIAVDTGFIVYNERNYPGFCRLLTRLGMGEGRGTQHAPMSFSVRGEATGREYGGASPLGLIAQPSNVFRPSYWRLLAGIARLGREGKAMLATATPEMTIGDLCRTGRVPRDVLEQYLLPMASAIWSAPRHGLMDFPAAFFLRFFDNHGMLDLRERPSWRTISGGSREYVSRLVAPFRERCRVSCPVRAISRDGEGVQIESAAGRERFDHVVLACHADQALRLLADASAAEREVLRAMPFQANDVVLHRDRAALPRSRWAWAGWNYRLPGPSKDDARPERDALEKVTGREGGKTQLPTPNPLPLGADSPPPVVTYNMTMLQSLRTREPLCVTLNDSAAINPAAVLGRYDYSHPQYTVPGIAARARWAEISGNHTRTHYCGAYWFNGFHEDGVQSAARVAETFGATL